MAISLSEIHKQINLDLDYTDDDVYLALLLAACTIAVKNRINDITDNDITAVEPLKLAILLLIANMYANREPVAYAQTYIIPYTFDFLIAPYVIY